VKFVGELVDVGVVGVALELGVERFEVFDHAG
jgi:hypothetical protein